MSFYFLLCFKYWRVHTQIHTNAFVFIACKNILRRICVPINICKRWVGIGMGVSPTERRDACFTGKTFREFLSPHQYVPITTFPRFRATVQIAMQTFSIVNDSPCCESQSQIPYQNKTTTTQARPSRVVPAATTSRYRRRGQMVCETRHEEWCIHRLIGVGVTGARWYESALV